MPKFFDISLPLHGGMIVWPGDTKFERQESRGTAIVSKLTLSTHTGTHIDAPRHFLFDKGGVDEIAIGKLIGKCKVIEIKSPSRGTSVFSPPARGGDGEGVGGGRLKSNNQVQISDIKRFNIRAGDRILFKTRNLVLLAKKQFTADYVSLALDAAKYLAAKKISLVGIDYFGIEAKSAPGHPVHKTLLRAGIVILEGLNLSKVKPGNYNLAALPLKIKNGDGSPARVVLWK